MIMDMMMTNVRFCLKLEKGFKRVVRALKQLDKSAKMNKVKNAHRNGSG